MGQFRFPCAGRIYGVTFESFCTAVQYNKETKLSYCVSFCSYPQIQRSIKEIRGSDQFITQIPF